MGWRDTVRRRDERRKVADRDLPPSMRQGSEQSSVRILWPYPVVGILLVVALSRHAWEHGDPVLLFVVVAMIVLAGFVATVIRRAHRSKGRKERRAEPEVDSIRWDEPRE